MQTPLTATLLVRAHATPLTGAGHAMRCLGLVEQWVGEGGRADIWGTITMEFVRNRAARLGVPIVTNPSRNYDMLLVDVYNEEERRDLATTNRARLRVLVEDFDGPVDSGYHAVWNPNAYADESLYNGFIGRLIIGQRYLPVREDLPTWVGGGLGAVSMGAGQTTEHLREVLSQLPAALALPRLQCVGEAPASEYQSIRSDDIWSSLRFAPWLICAMGSTTWEAAVVGIPFVGVIATENHETAAKWVSSQGVPVVDARPGRSPSEIVASLATAVKSAGILPLLRPGAKDALRELRKLISW